MTDFGVFGACAKRVHGVYMILAVVFGASAGQAGAWEEFERRCLVPMEAVTDPITEGLSPLVADQNGTQVAYGWTPNDGAYVFLANTSDDWQRTMCALTKIQMDRFEDLEAKVGAWVETELSASRYVRHDVYLNNSAITLLSTDWREPKVEVVFDVSGRARVPTMQVRETDLES